MRGRRLGIPDFTRAPWPLLFAAAGAAFLFFVLNERHAGHPVFCAPIEGGSIIASWLLALETIFILRSPIHALTGWALMLVAMMLPLLAMPLMYVWHSSLRRKRLRACAAFLLGYFCVWMAAGPLLIAFSLLFQLVYTGHALAAASLLALLWSASPWHRAALKRGHRVRRIGLFGWAADRDCLLFGAQHGVWCVASCWAWMLVPNVAGQWHVPVMLCAGAIMLAERLAQPGRPRWRWPLVLSWLGRRIALATQRSASVHG